ncbi:putative protein-S-isoprenylcysteine methyltransferase [Encephalitozoon romaleae SJ-2008]|uniref:Protein-S-isoprenylcysteine O-methyltransferase n=1 Tax=Encephalitozoon romaleae (strain SJ-2008) TaxID=1178016 RepID=I6ZGZ6_ENCRO|nr:putative protein-S-isoprenylcysteine methyltransferase [Encephalitozoon romaleae SJ-2008]AFN82463.1 putative protein-S-isoprenylcysteine methyltransferase [Encephalitozoon romaleae SJ-2008]
MECPSFYFALGSLFMLGISHSSCYLALHIVSSTSLLIFLHSRERVRNIDFGMRIIRHDDFVILFGCLLLESLFVPKSAGYFGGRVLKAVAACGLVFSITFFFVTLRHMPDNKTGGRRIQRSGPYRFVRHPLYSSLILYWASCTIYLSCFVSLAIFLWFVSSRIIPRIKECEREMVSTSSEYMEYRKAVWSGIPMYR